MFIFIAQISYLSTGQYWPLPVIGGIAQCIDITASSVARLSFRKDPKNISNSFWKYLIFKVSIWVWRFMWFSYALTVTKNIFQFSFSPPTWALPSSLSWIKLNPLARITQLASMEVADSR